MSTLNCTDSAIPSQRPSWRYAWEQAVALAGVHRDASAAASRRRAQVRALHELSDETLRDIGLYESRSPRQPTLSALEVERWRWR